MRPVTIADLRAYENDKNLHSLRDTEFRVSISDVDKQNGSPKIGDMIARNPKNHNDQWLVAEKYFKDNFEELNQAPTDVLTTEIIVLRERNAEMLEMLIYLYNFSKGMHFHAGSVTDKEVQELITKAKEA